MNNRGDKGVAIIIVLIFFLTAAMGLTSLGHLGGTHMRNANHHLKSIQSFYLAEAAYERAKQVLRDNYTGTPLGTSGIIAMGDGEFLYTISNTADAIPTKRRIVGVAAIPTIASPLANRSIEVIVNKPDDLPADFWDYAVYSADDINANGNAYSVTGDAIAGGDIIYSQDHFDSGEFEDPSKNPLPYLNFDVIKAMAQSQSYFDANCSCYHDNYYTASEIGSVPFPSTFYNVPPDPLDPTDLGTPHVVYIEGDLNLNGNWGNMGGFIVVVGDITTGASAAINGNGWIDGVIYALGEMTINGGGGGINIDGGIFAADDVTLNGNTTVFFNQAYMDAIDGLNLPTGMTVLSWNEIASPI